MKIHDVSDLEDLSHAELDKIIHDPHITRDQLNIVAAYFQHLNAIKDQEVSELEKRMARVEQRLAELRQKHS